MKLLSRAAYLLAIFAFTFCAAVLINWVSVPNHNTDTAHFDTLIVLGYPTNPDGSPSPEQRERVLEAVREYKSGVASQIIVTGAAAHNSYPEARAMSKLALENGVPSAAIAEEPLAHNTIQNLVYSARIMREHGWSTAEIVSSPSHLTRAAILVDDLNRQQPDLSINWRTHAAHWPTEYSATRILLLYAYECWSALKIRLSPPTMNAPAISR